ncbi:SDR family NAD(P)-dependent oxidoreductase [Roseibium sediminicola]|uniref:SDR family oxidoreductase n=1 Tax=Roseibium sediminicola TaxID=2933272 RepID=A0ABT0H1Z2_9HYPH|nr:SDR family oxidoreductase [Roseibium sp. CAU 1639]MCK7615714.1 SDR family oxidoreductase [Roseibium sp. CAU 1639]
MQGKATQWDFTGHRVLVTGGSRGIAAELSYQLAMHSADVAVNFSAAADSRFGRAEAAQSLVSRIKADGGRATCVEQDLMLEDGGTQLATKTLDAMGAIDTLVLSASIQYHVPFLLQTPKDVSEQLRINLQSNIELLQTLMPHMAQAEYGRILAIGSIQEVSPSPEMPIYAMTKAAMKNLVENLAVQSASRGIMINNIAPGLIQTDRNAFRRSDPSDWDRLQSTANPVGRAGLPGDLTSLALHLLSPENTFTTGATIYSTGGGHIPVGTGGHAELVLPKSTEETANRMEVSPQV